MSLWDTHKERWEECEECQLCELRQKISLYRGKIPCDVLFVGDSPGVAEDQLGTPFIGPAGHLLDRLIEKSIPDTMRIGYTYAVGCISYDESGRKVKDSPKSAIKACRIRLEEIIKISKPKAIVRVGKLPEKEISEERYPDSNLKLESIIHPAAIMRADISQKGLWTQRNIVTLKDLVEELGI